MTAWATPVCTLARLPLYRYALHGAAKSGRNRRCMRRFTGRHGLRQVVPFKSMEYRLATSRLLDSKPINKAEEQTSDFGRRKKKCNHAGGDAGTGRPFFCKCSPSST